MKVKTKVFVAELFIGVISHLRSLEVSGTFILNPFNWTPILGFIYVKRSESDGRGIVLELPMGRFGLEYKDPAQIYHQLLHDATDRIKANILKEGETMESAGYGRLEPKGCGEEF